MSEHGVLTAEELALLPEQAREWYNLAAVSLHSQAQERVFFLCRELAQALMAQANLAADLLEVLENGNIKSLCEFARRHADRLGVPLPDGWVPTAEREQAETAAVQAGHIPNWRF